MKINNSTIKDDASIICSECKNKIAPKEIKGSYKHPYCAKCFQKVWNGNYAEYFKWLEATHC